MGEAARVAGGADRCSLEGGGDGSIFDIFDWLYYLFN